MVVIAVVYSIAILSPDVLSHTSEDSAGDLVIRNVTVVSPERAAPLEHAYVRIRDGKIAEVTTRPSTAGREIDGTGRFLVPGLIDSHVHLTEVPGMRAEHEARHPQIAAAYRAQQPRSYLYFGFTTVIDLLSTADSIARWNEESLRPDAYFCGGAPIANGYPMIFTPEEMRFRAFDYFLYDERQQDQIPDYVDPEAHTPAAVVSRMVAAGAICVKTHYETGFGSFSDLPLPPLAMVRALVEASHGQGLPVVLHANSRAAQEFAVDAGVDIVAHGLWNGIDVDGALPGDDVDALLGRMADDGIGYQPTFQVLYGELELFNQHYLENGMLAHAYPVVLIDWYKTPEGAWFREQVGAGLAGRDAMAIYAPILRRLNQVVATLAHGDARLLFGSDTPSAPTYANPPGLNGLLEIRRWAEAGIDEAQIFRALTLANARAFGLDDTIGSIEKGKTAHLLLLRENPLASVAAYDTIEQVIVRGQPVERDQLSALNAAAP